LKEIKENSETKDIENDEAIKNIELNIKNTTKENKNAKNNGKSLNDNIKNINGRNHQNRFQANLKEHNINISKKNSINKNKYSKGISNYMTMTPKKNFFTYKNRDYNSQSKILKPLSSRKNMNIYNYIKEKNGANLFKNDNKGKKVNISKNHSNFKPIKDKEINIIQKDNINKKLDQLNDYAGNKKDNKNHDIIDTCRLEKYETLRNQKNKYNISPFLEEQKKEEIKQDNNINKNINNMISNFISNKNVNMSLSDSPDKDMNKDEAETNQMKLTRKLSLNSFEFCNPINRYLNLSKLKKDNNNNLKTSINDSFGDSFRKTFLNFVKKGKENNISNSDSKFNIYTKRNNRSEAEIINYMEKKKKQLKLEQERQNKKTQEQKFNRNLILNVLNEDIITNMYKNIPKINNKKDKKEMKLVKHIKINNSNIYFMTEPSQRKVLDIKKQYLDLIVKNNFLSNNIINNNLINDNKKINNEINSDNRQIITEKNKAIENTNDININNQNNKSSQLKCKEIFDKANLFFSEKKMKPLFQKNKQKNLEEEKNKTSEINNNNNDNIIINSEEKDDIVINSEKNDNNNNENKDIENINKIKEKEDDNIFIVNHTIMSATVHDRMMRIIIKS